MCSHRNIEGAGTKQIIKTSKKKNATWTIMKLVVNNNDLRPLL